jgi:RNA polymerase sigma-70 factor (ECF subfamily)
MAARITRGKKKIEVARIPFAMPAESELPERLDTVLTVIHLFFTAGHTASSGDELVDAAVVGRAIDLARMLHQLLPYESEVQGLLALLLLTDVRSKTRVDPSGSLVLLKDQDRSRWDAAQIDEGRSVVTLALMRRPPGRFALQAAIAAVHAEAPSYEETDWAELLALYDVLLTAWPSPVVELNRAVVVAELHGPEAALAIVDALEADGRLVRYAYLPATRADLLRRLNRRSEAAQSYEWALELADNEVERAFLQDRLAEVRV